MSERLSLVDLTIRYDGATAVDNVSLSLPTGVIGCLLGPSGCGKTSILRTIAGFGSPSAGVVRLHGDTVAGAGWGHPPEQRRVGMIFQDLALFPHLNVADNIAFGLPKKPVDERRRRVEELLDLVGLPGMGRR